MNFGDDTIASLSDDELLVKLKEYGISIGPITATTRPLYEKRLKIKMEDNKELKMLSDEQLFSTMKRYGLNVGPITSTTRALYEKRLKAHLESMPAANIEIQSSRTRSSEKATTKSNQTSSKTTAFSDYITATSDRSNNDYERGGYDATAAAASTSTASSSGVHAYSNLFDSPTSSSRVTYKFAESSRPGLSTSFEPLSLFSASSGTSASKQPSPPRSLHIDRDFIGQNLNGSYTTDRTSPPRDKFAERLSSYGMLRTPQFYGGDDQHGTQSISLSTSRLATPTSIRSRATLSQAARLIDEQANKVPKNSSSSGNLFEYDLNKYFFSFLLNFNFFYLFRLFI
jgi:hypothetical protein